MIAAAPGGPTGRRRRIAPLLVLAIFLVLAVAVAVVSQVAHRNAEQRLLQERADQAGAVLTTAISGVQSPLAAAAELAEVSAGNTNEFEAVMSRAIADQLFVAAALFEVTSPEPLVVIGSPALVDAAPDERIDEMLAQAVATDALSVVDTLDLPGRRLGYAYTSSREAPRYVAYTESALPSNRTAGPRPDEPFAQLDYALYLGVEETDHNLLYASRADLPIGGRRAATTVGFGDRQLTLVVTTDATLSGGLSGATPWILGLAVAVVGVGAAAVTARLQQRRRDAERIAADLSRLNAELQQRTRTLQRSLLPEALPAPRRFEVAGGYWPATGDVEVGGDFYDVFPIRGGRWGIAIGDVCGRGITAAALTGLTRHTIRAAARHVDAADEVLRWVHEAIRDSSPDTYATVCFAFLHGADNGTAARLELALGGHPRPLLVGPDGTVTPIGRHGTLLGMVEPRLGRTTHDVAPGAALVFYTDGLTDAPGDQAITLDELRTVVARSNTDGARGILAGIEATISSRRDDGAADDTAVVVLRRLTAS